MSDPRQGGWPTLADVHAAVVQVDLRLMEILARQDEHRRRLEGLEKETSDLDGRVDDLRSWRSLVRGGLALAAVAAGAVLSAAGAIVAQSIGGGGG